MHKKLLAIALILAICLAATACLNNTTTQTATTTTTTTQNETTITTTTTTTNESTDPNESTESTTEATEEPVVIYYQALPAEEMYKVDLNNDGEIDRVTYTVTNDYSFQLIVNSHIAGEIGENFLESAWFLTDLDIHDDYLDLAIQELGPSDDPFVCFYYLKENQLVYRGKVPGSICDPYSETLESDPYGLGTIELDGLGGLNARARGDVMFTWFYSQPWVLDSAGQLMQIEQDYIYLTGYDADAHLISDEYEITMKLDLPLVLEPGDTTASLVARSGETGYLVKTDNKKWVQMRTESGELGWFELGDNAYSVIVGASEYFSEEVFAGLDFAD